MNPNLVYSNPKDAKLVLLKELEYALTVVTDPIDRAFVQSQILALEIDSAQGEVYLHEKEVQSLQVSAYHTPTQPKLTTKLECAKVALSKVKKKLLERN